MRVVIFVAHPDDEVLGMGGTILKHSQKGDFVKSSIFSNWNNFKKILQTFRIMFHMTKMKIK